MSSDDHTPETENSLPYLSDSFSQQPQEITHRPLTEQELFRDANYWVPNFYTPTVDLLLLDDHHRGRIKPREPTPILKPMLRDFLLPDLIRFVAALGGLVCAAVWISLDPLLQHIHDPLTAHLALWRMPALTASLISCGAVIAMWRARRWASAEDALSVSLLTLAGLLVAVLPVSLVTIGLGASLALSQLLWLGSLFFPNRTRVDRGWLLGDSPYKTFNLALCAVLIVAPLMGVGWERNEVRALQLRYQHLRDVTLAVEGSRCPLLDDAAATENYTLPMKLFDQDSAIGERLIACVSTRFPIPTPMAKTLRVSDTFKITARLPQSSEAQEIFNQRREVIERLEDRVAAVVADLGPASRSAYSAGLRALSSTQPCGDPYAAPELRPLRAADPDGILTSDCTGAVLDSSPKVLQLAALQPWKLLVDPAAYRGDWQPQYPDAAAVITSRNYAPKGQDPAPVYETLLYRLHSPQDGALEGWVERGMNIRYLNADESFSKDSDAGRERVGSRWSRSYMSTGNEHWLILYGEGWDWSNVLQLIEDEWGADPTLIKDEKGFCPNLMWYWEGRRRKASNADKALITDERGSILIKSYSDRTKHDNQPIRVVKFRYYDRNICHD